ncbi:MAG: alkaline phosphatase family protein [Candidatus Izemoplasmatales bacterium]|nr:alkaline phosphatase family protein [bacterium]MDZ4196307.1 alkaline phosphatase family protein [Candidatus Izemoplasmatales bacterium]
MKPIYLPDYENSILNLSNSILKSYQITPNHSTIPLVDELLKQQFRNVVLIVVDGLGSKNIDRLMPATSILHQWQVSTLSSVFPPTTVAATTALLSAKSPIETGWLGWCQYIKEVDKSVVFFTNQDYYDEATIFEDHLASKYVAYETILEQIHKAQPHVKTLDIFPAFRTPTHITFQKQVETLLTTLEEDMSHFVYVYWDQLDSKMHEFGPGSVEVKAQADEIEQAILYLHDHLPSDTIALITADHGQVEVCPIDITKYQAIMDCLRIEPSIESRATSFFVKEDRKEVFEQTFRHYFRDYFVLYTKEDVLKMKLFGNGTPHPKFDEFLGDYLAVAIDHYYFKMNRGRMEMRGQHAGILVDEMLVPLIVLQKK